MCLYPKLIDNPKYKRNKKNGGNIPVPPDKRVLKVPIGCGNCIECRKQKANAWRIRLNEELRTQELKPHYVTLTFNRESLKELKNEFKDVKGYDLENAVASLSIRRFTERWRAKHKKSIRHWLVTELGHQGTNRLHLHGIVWTNEEPEEIEKHWKYGFVWNSRNQKKGWVNEQTINYIVKYITKVDNKHKGYKSKTFVSNGIGKGYIEREDHKRNVFKKNRTNENYITRNGIKLALPIYYRNKIYTEEEREQLWLNKINEGIIYVRGTKIDINKPNGIKDLENILLTEQKYNKSIGYGDYNWKRENYKEELKKINSLAMLD